jgi:hypothetical protein
MNLWKEDSPSFLRQAALIILLMGYLLLSSEIRYEHRAVLAERWQAWIPVAYSLMMATVGMLCAVTWTRIAQALLMCGFAAGILVGAAGVWFHTDGHLAQAASRWLTSILSAPGQVLSLESTPPMMAPLAFMGLGLLGLLLCLERMAADRQSARRAAEDRPATAGRPGAWIT